MVALSYHKQSKSKKALRWYQDSISEIDGNPDQVTKMSQLWNNFTRQKP